MPRAYRFATHRRYALHRRRMNVSFKPLYLDFSLNILAAGDYKYAIIIGSAAGCRSLCRSRRRYGAGRAVR